MNYMEQVAHMLGVELGEEFRVTGFYQKNRVCKIDVDGLYSRQITEDPNYWYRDIVGTILYGLLLGEVKIIKKPEENNGE